MNFDESPSPKEVSAPEPLPEPGLPPQTPILREGKEERVPFGVFDLVLFVLIAAGGMILIGVLLVIVFGAFGVKLATIQHSSRDQNLISVIGQVIVDVGLLAYLAAQMRFRFGLPPWRTLGWRKLDTNRIPLGWACAGLLASGAIISLLVDAASALHPPGKPLPIETIYQDRLSSLLFMLMAVLLAPIVEETVFRGYIYPVLAQNWGVGSGIVITGALFGMLHGFQLGGARWQILLLVIVGVIFTWVRARTRTVVASYLMHLGYNSFLFVQFLVLTHFLTRLPDVR